MEPGGMEKGSDFKIAGGGGGGAAVNILIWTKIWKN